MFPQWKVLTVKIEQRNFFAQWLVIAFWTIAPVEEQKSKRKNDYFRDKIAQKLINRYLLKACFEGSAFLRKLRSFRLEKNSGFPMGVCNGI